MPEEFFSVFEDMRSEIDRLSDEVQTLNLIVGPTYQIGVVDEELPAGDFGKVRLSSPVWVTDKYELKSKPYTVKVFNPTEEAVEVDEQINCCRNQWGVWIYVVGGGGPDKSPIIPVELVQVGGTQGDGTTPATWTYDVYLAPKLSGDTTVLDAADPVATPHWYQRPNVGQVEPAFFGLAWRIKKDPPPPEPAEGEDPEDPYEYELTWINEAIIGAICEEEEPAP